MISSLKFVDLMLEVGGLRLAWWRWIKLRYEWRRPRASDFFHTGNQVVKVQFVEGSVNLFSGQNNWNISTLPNSMVICEAIFLSLFIN